MADIYVDSNAVGAGTGADWANAYTTLAAAFTGGAAGDTFYVAHNHAQTQASALTLTNPGTAASPCRIICVSSAGSVPPVSADLATTATVATTGANAMTLGGNTGYWYGIQFSCGSGAVNSGLNTGSQILDNCVISKAGTTGQANAVQSTGKWINSTLSFGAAADSASGTIIWDGGTYSGAATTNGVFGTTAYFRCFGVDFSSLGSGNVIARGAAAETTRILKNCKLGASVSVSGTPTFPISTTDLINCDSGDTNYRTERYMYQGTLTTETTTVRTGGASNGTTTIAWKVVPTANNERVYPFQFFPISIWNETTGSAVTLTIEGTWGGGAVPTTNDIWMDVEYLGTSGFPISTTTNGNVDPLATGTNHTASSETWGAGGTTKFKMAVSVTPQEKGPIRVYIKYGNATNTVWIDPRITLS